VGEIEGSDVPESSQAEPVPGLPEADSLLEDLDNLVPSDANYATRAIEAIPGQLLNQIDSQIRVLRAESLQDSLESLADVNMFFGPGPPPETGGFFFDDASMLPLSPQVGQRDLHTIMSNRRFLKVYRELSALPESRASDLVNAHVDSALAEYDALYDSYLAENRQYYTLEALEGSSSIAGPSFAESNVPDGQIVLVGAKLKVLTLAWVAGTVGLQDTRTAITRVTREALSQREQLYTEAELHPFFRQQMLERGGLYNRQILATALIGVCGDSRAAQKISGELGLEWQERKLTHFDARLTTYDVPVMRGIIQPDFSRGTQVVRAVKSMDDSTFGRIVEIVERLNAPIKE